MLEVPSFWKNYVSFLKVSNYTAKLPIGTKKVILASYVNGDYSKLEKMNCYSENDVQDSSEFCENKFCDGECINYFNIVDTIIIPYENEVFSANSPLSDLEFIPMRYVSSKYSSVDLDNYLKLNIHDSSFEFSIVNDEIIKTSFQEGWLAVAYQGLPISKDGLVIPIDSKILEALSYYLDMKMAEKAAWTKDMSYLKIADNFYQKWNRAARIASSSVDILKHTGQKDEFIRSFQNILPMKNYYKP